MPLLDTSFQGPAVDAIGICTGRIRAIFSDSWILQKEHFAQPLAFRTFKL
jgi:hypothetical protein